MQTREVREGVGAKARVRRLPRASLLPQRHGVLSSTDVLACSLRAPERLWTAFLSASSRGKNQAFGLRLSTTVSLEKSTPISKSPLFVVLPRLCSASTTDFGTTRRTSATVPWRPAYWRGRTSSRTRTGWPTAKPPSPSRSRSLVVLSVVCATDLESALGVFVGGDFASGAWGAEVMGLPVDGQLRVGRRCRRERRAHGRLGDSWRGAFPG